jgi:hypothetical protein
MDTADGTTEGEDLNLSFSRHEVLLLARYTAAKVALQQLRFYFLLKWLVLLPVALLIFDPDDPISVAIAVVAIVVFVLLFLTQTVVRRILARVGAFRRLAKLDAIVDDLWNGYKEQSELVTDLSSKRTWIGLTFRLARSRGAVAEDELMQKLMRVDWDKLMPPRGRFVEARAALAEAAQRR